MPLLLLLACTDAPPGAEPPPPRADGDRAPLAEGCDPLDGARCWLPWPSSVHTRVDEATPTGLRVSVDPSVLPLPDDDPRWLDLADGFSRLSPALTAAPGALVPADDAVRMFVGYTDGQPAATELRAWSEVVVDGETSLVIGYPSTPLPWNADVVVVVRADALRDGQGQPAQNERLDRVALGVEAADTAEEEAVYAWYAPIRRVLDDAGVAPDEVYRAWSFTTRSAEDPAARLRAMLDDVAVAELSVTLTDVDVRNTATIAAVVEGRVEGVPQYREDEEGWIALDADGRPTAVGTHGAPFRVVIPAGAGDYPVAMYGHGTGGDVDDATFDEDIAARGLAKAGIRFWGWNGEELVEEITYLSHVFDGTSRSTSALLQSVADGQAILQALSGPLADALAADTLLDQPNPAAGRRPDVSRPLWVGGSLGGTMGAVFVAASPELDTAVLNVPAAAWTHLIPRASLYTLLAEPLTEAWYPTDLDARAAIAMSQNVWDDVDGAAVEDDGSVLLLQESIGDPVVPNVGTAMLAHARGAAVVAAPLDDWLVGLEVTDGVEGRTGITQYHTAFTEDYDIHGFAALSGPAGDAAREQIEAFLTGWRAGVPEPIVVPSGCLPEGACDFSGE